MEGGEVELIDYLNVLWRWKWLIAAGTLVCVIVAGLVSILLPKTYRIGIAIEAGDLSDEHGKDVERLVARLNAGSFLQDVVGLHQTGPIGLAAQFKKPLLIQLEMETRSPEEAVKVIDRVANKVVDELQRLLKAQQGKNETELKSLREQIDQLRAERKRQEWRVQELRQSLENLRKVGSDILGRAGDPAWALVFMRLSDEIVTKEGNLAELERQLTVVLPARVGKLEGQADELAWKVAAVHPARLLRAPGNMRVSISPRLKLNLAVSAIAGFMGSVLLAFFVEYLQEAQKASAEG